MTYLCIAVLLTTKPSSDDDSGFMHGFGAEASLPLAQSTPELFNDTTRLCMVVFTLWKCHMNADAVRALSCFFMYFLLSDGEIPRLVKNSEVELIMKPRYIYIYIYIHVSTCVCILYQNSTHEIEFASFGIV